MPVPVRPANPAEGASGSIWPSRRAYSRKVKLRRTTAGTSSTAADSMLAGHAQDEVGLTQVGFRQLPSCEPVRIGAAAPAPAGPSGVRSGWPTSAYVPAEETRHRRSKGAGQQTLGGRGATDVAGADAEDGPGRALGSRVHPPLKWAAPAVRLTAVSASMAMIGSMSDLLVRHGPKLAVGGLVLLNLVLIGALVLRDPVRTAVPAEPVPASSPTLTATVGVRIERVAQRQRRDRRSRRPPRSSTPSASPSIADRPAKTGGCATSPAGGQLRSGGVAGDLDRL